jgi:flagellar hook-basal body complex protein FliE
MGSAFTDSLNAVNNIKLEASRMQEDIAMGGSTNIHDAMIAAEKAELSMQMAIQVRNRILSALSFVVIPNI